MGDPVSIAISLGLTAAGGIMGAQGAAQKDDATAAMYNYKAGVAQANQKIAAQNAQTAMLAGGAQEQLVGLRGGQELGGLTTHLAGSGLQLGSRTSQDVLRSQTAGIQTQEATTMWDAQRRAYGERVQAMNFAAEAGMDISSAQFARQQKGLDVASSLLGGAASVADKWLKYSQAGVGSGSGGFNILGG